MTTKIRIIILVLGLVLCHSLSVMAVAFSSSDTTISVAPPSGQSNAPPVPAQLDDDRGTQPPIDSFTFEFKEYDSSLDPKYLAEDQTNNQKGLDKAFENYKSNAYEAYLSQQRSCYGNQECIASARTLYQAKLRSAQFRYEQMKAECDINYRIALSAAKKNQQALLDKKRQDLKNSLSERTRTRDRATALDEIEDFIAGTKKGSPEVIIPPEEYYPTRHENQRRTSRNLSAATMSQEDEEIIRKLARGNSSSVSCDSIRTSTSAGMRAKQSKAELSCDSLASLFDRLTRQNADWPDQVLGAKIDSLSKEMEKCLSQSAQTIKSTSK